MRPVVLLVWLAALLWAAPARASGVVWAIQPVRVGATDTAAPVEVRPGKAATFWLDPLEVVRVRRLSGGAPRFARVVAASGTEAVLDEPGIPAAPDVWYLAQPPGHGDVWSIGAREAALIVVERPVRRRGRDVWDQVERDVLAWIDAGGDAPPPDLPLTAGTAEAELRLVAEQQLAGRMGRGVTRAASAWRKASAAAILTALRPLYEGPFALSDVDVPGAGDEVAVSDDEDARPWRKLASGAHFTVALDGPGALRVEARPVAGGVPARVTVLAGDLVLGRAVADSDPVAAPDEVSPPPAFPPHLPLVADGVQLGSRAQVTVSLPERSAVTIVIEGGPLLIRAVHALRHPRLFSAEDSPASWAARARRALAGNDSPAAAILRARLAHLDGQPAPEAPAIEDPPPELGWFLILERARHLAASDDEAGLRDLLADLKQAPPPAVLAVLGPLLPEPTLVERLRSPHIAALDLAWRGRPIDPAVLAEARAAWRAGSWTLAVPDAHGDTRPRPWTWLVEAAPDPLAVPASLAVLTKARVVAPPAPGDLDRAARLDVYLRTDADRPGPITLTVDGEPLSLLALRPVERLEVAVRPGPHDIALQGPPGTRAFTNLFADGPRPPGGADLRRYWPLALDDEPVRWDLPDPSVPGHIRVSLRALDPVPGEPIKVAIRTDVGERRTITFTPGPVDDLAQPLDAPSRVSAEATFTVRLPPNAREVWLTASGKRPLVGSVAVRSSDPDDAKATDAAKAAGTAKGSGAANDEVAGCRLPASDCARLEAIARLSRDLTDHPRDQAALLARANLLLDLDLPDLARSDLSRLAALPLSPANGPAANLLVDRVAAFTEATHVGVADLSHPTPLAPALLGLPAAELTPLVPAARALRRLGPADARAALPDDDSDATRALRALVAGDGRALARASTRIPVQLEAAVRLADSLDSGDAPRGTASVLMGLASALRLQIDHPRLRRALSVAFAQSRWNAVEGTERNAGQDRLQLESAPPDNPRTAAREALVAAPWSPRRSRILTPGVGLALEAEVGAATRLTTQVHCVELRPGPTPGSCMVTVKVDGSELRVRAAAGAGPGSVPPRSLSAGRHSITVELDGKDPDVLASIRFLTDRPLLGRPPGERSPDGYELYDEPNVRVFAATPDRPVELAVLGPSTLRVDLVAQGEPATAEITIRPPRGAARTQQVTVAPSTTPLEVPILLLDVGAHRVSVKPARGRLLTRFALREDSNARPPPLPPPWWDDAPPSSLLPWPPLPAPLTTITGEPWDGCPPSGFGTLSLELSAGSEPIGERDVLGTVLGVAQVGLDYRRRAGDSFWFRLGAFGRRRDGTEPVAGVATRLYARDLPLDLRLDARGGAVTERFAKEQAQSATLSLRLDRSFSLGDTLSFVPSLAARGAWLSLDRDTFVAAAADIDPDVYNDYLRTHALQVTARAGLYLAPWADQVGMLNLFAASTRTMTADHVGAELEWRSLFPVLGETYAALSYRPTYRLVTADRTDAFLRHDLGLGLQWSIFTGEAGRFVLGLDGWLVATSGSTRQGFGLTLRYDLTLGRGLDDILPVDESFESLVEKRPWEPTPPGEL